MRYPLYCWYFLIFYGLLACEKENPVKEDPIHSIIAEEELSSAVLAFGEEIFKELIDREEEPKNLIVSPLSVAVALYMTYNGSDGTTREAMAQALSLDNISPESLNAGFEELSKLLVSKNDSVELNMANAIFWDKNRVTPFESFLEALENTYEAEPFSEQFETAPQAVLDKINAWVDDKTEGRIDKILEELDPREIIFLINALYFLGDWDQPFPPEQTIKGDFYLSNGSQISADMMNQDNHLNTYIGDDYQSVACAFTDTNFIMYFVLPPEDNGIDAFIKSFDLEGFVDQLDSRFQKQRVYLFVPKFEIEYKIKLNDVLKSLGMEIAFDMDRANFSKIGQVAYGNPYISRVEHKTYLKIDEKGAEGAAVTAVGIGITSVPPTIRFNRPFMVMLVHKATGIPIFVGKVENPVEES